MTTKALVLAIGLGAFLVAGPAYAAVSPPDACQEKKAKASGKKAFDLMKAFGKNIKKSNGVKLGADWMPVTVAVTCWSLAEAAPGRHARRAAIISAICRKRCSRSLASARWTIVAAAGGTSGRSSRTGSGVRVWIALTVLATFPTKGLRPVSIS